MSEAVLTVLLVTSSAKGSSLVYRWPHFPHSSPRLARPRQTTDALWACTDNPWRAANAPETQEPARPKSKVAAVAEADEDYLWKQPHLPPSRTVSFSASASHPASRRASPSKVKELTESFRITLDECAHIPLDLEDTEEYENVLGYTAEFLASMLCPQRAMCHQKFELVVDDLAFIGHPVCAERDGGWRFQSEKSRSTSRGRGSKKDESDENEAQAHGPEKPGNDSSLQTFHFVVVLDLPDPSSSASGNISKYFDVIYEQIVFTVTAVLYQEQVTGKFVETECDNLVSIKDDYVARGKPFEDYMSEALTVSSIARAMKVIYEAVKANQIARISLNNIVLELQLPPYLDSLLHIDEDADVDFVDCEDDYEERNTWGSMGFAWRLPALAPWKALLRLDDGTGDATVVRPLPISTEDQGLAAELVKLLQQASIDISLADLASVVDWDLETQVYPVVRWLVHHRRAKIVDMVHPGLKTVFTVSQKFNRPLAELTAEFARVFANENVPPLPMLLGTISAATHRQGANHFYAVVDARDQLPVYRNVVVWLLRHDLLVTLHLRIRVVATETLKERVRVMRESALARRAWMTARALSIGRRGSSTRGREDGALETVEEISPENRWFSLSPKSARRYFQGQAGSGSGAPVEKTEEKIEGTERTETEEEDEDGVSSTDEGLWEKEIGWDDTRASMINDPGRATPLERRWLAAMSEDKDPLIAHRFEQINQYFDGKCTDDEILYKAEITRKQLREVLHHYDEYLQTFLHPS